MPAAGPDAGGGPAAPRADLRAYRPAVAATGEKYAYDAAHGRQVSMLALDLFAALHSVHQLPPEWAPALEHAALLHDIGYFISARRHHRHSRYLIRNDAALSGYPAPWRDFVALVAGNHRKRPRPAPRSWARPIRDAARVLAAILRVADGLDYGHDGLSRIVSAQHRQGAVRIVVAGPHLPALEPVLRKKSRLFARTFGTPVVFAMSRSATGVRRRHPTGREAVDADIAPPGSQGGA